MSRLSPGRLVLSQVGFVSALVVGALVVTATPARSQGPVPSVGRPASAADINQWDHDSSPDGSGLPVGRGTARVGAAVFEMKCAACHGASGEGGIGDRLVGPDPWTVGTPRTVGNYWPYATTLVDYVYRAMPFNAPGSLTPDETYSVAAWILFQNGLVGEDDELNRTTVVQVQMPGRNVFVPDARPDAQP